MEEKNKCSDEYAQKESLLDDNTSKMMTLLNWSYDKALSGLPLPGCESVDELAQSYINGDGTLSQKVESLIRWQIAKCSTSGFLTSCGGAITLPVTLASIGVNLTSVLYVQLRMVAAIAKMGGYDVRDDQVKTLAYICLLGNSTTTALKQAGIKAGNKIAEKFIEKHVTRDVLKKINDFVAFRLVTKAGEKGIINLGKLVPIAGGFVGAVFDGATTKAIGNAAKRIFIDEGKRKLTRNKLWK